SQFVVHTKARRLLADMDDIRNFLQSSAPGICNEIINYAYPHYYDLKEIIGAIERKTGKKAIYDEVEEGDFYQVDFSKDIISFFSGITPEEYINTLAEKYS